MTTAAYDADTRPETHAVAPVDTPSVTLHIGPGKTGSTSVQTALRDAADELAGHGVTIPRPGFSANGHLMAAFDYLHTHPDHFLPSNEYGFLHALGARFDGSWQRLVTTARASTGPVVISQEVLACLNPDGARAMVREFDPLPVRAVAMYRPVSALIGSLYQQEARLMTVPDFETYARRCVQLMLRPGIHEFSWVDSAWLQDTWQEAGVPLELVNAGPELTPKTLSALVSRILPPVVPPPLIERENPGLSAYGVDLWRRHLATCSPTYLAPTLRIFETFCAVDPWATDRDVGGRYALQVRVAELLDNAFPPPVAATADLSRFTASGDLDATTFRDDTPPVSPAAARAELAQLLDGNEPLTQRIPGRGANPDERLAHVGRRLARRQRQDDLIWSAATLLRRLQRRPPPLTADWSYDASIGVRPDAPV